MRIAFMIGILTALVAPPAMSQTSGWTCTAAKFADGHYEGGTTAYIHLSPYSSGHDYPVTRKGKMATGTTADGTPFKCTLKK